MNVLTHVEAANVLQNVERLVKIPGEKDPVKTCPHNVKYTYENFMYASY